jgi:FkbM family methyltransferase
MTVQQLETDYGTMFVPDTDLGQYWWLANTRASPEDVHIEPVVQMLSERPRGCAVDVGANFGCWTLPLAKVSHSVVAIEPQDSVYALLERSVAANRLSNVRLYRHAAGSYPHVTQIPMLDIETSYNFGGVQVGKSYYDSDTEFIKVEPLDVTVMGERVSFIKIDVEGHEKEVLEGAEHIIRVCRPILFVERDHPDTDQEALREQIEGMGYALDILGGNFLGMPI